MTLKKPSSKLCLYFFVFIFTVIFIFRILPYLGITFAINASDSVSKKAFVILKGIEPKCGDYAAFYLKVHNEYWRYDTRFLKTFVGCPGDELSVKGRDFYLNGYLMGKAREKDSKGKPVDPFQWNGKIPPDNFFVLGDNERSYDSRYWGFVKKEWLVGKALAIY